MIVAIKSGISTLLIRSRQRRHPLQRLQICNNFCKEQREVGLLHIAGSSDLLAGSRIAPYIIEKGKQRKTAIKNEQDKI